MNAAQHSHDIDPDRVAAAVVDAVRSGQNRPGQTTVLTGHAVSDGATPASRAFPAHGARKLGMIMLCVLAILIYVFRIPSE